VIKQLKYRPSLLFTDLKNQTLRLFYVKCGYVDMWNTRADFYYVITNSHLFAFFVKYNTIFVKDRRLSIYDCFRLGQFALIIVALTHAALSRFIVVNRKRVYLLALICLRSEYRALFWSYSCWWSKPIRKGSFVKKIFRKYFGILLHIKSFELGCLLFEERIRLPRFSFTSLFSIFIRHHPVQREEWSLSACLYGTC